MSTPSTSRTSASSGNRGLWIVLGLVGLLVGTLVLLLCSFIFGTISGEEFSPDNFDRRTFSYIEIPLVHVQIWPVHRVSSTKSLESHLITNKLIPASSAAKPRWDLVRMTHVAPGSDKCDARILCKYFDSQNDLNTSWWLAWTEKHADLAKVFWPAIAKVAQQQLYIFVPDMFELARQATDAHKFQSELNLLLAKKYREFAEMQQGLERHEDAIKLFDESLGYKAESAAAFRGRAKSYEALEESDKAAADRLAASKLPDDS
jgi:hypothetical protein